MSVQVVKLERPNPRQEEFLKCEKKYVAFGGARGGGKSWAVRTKAVLMALKYPGIRILLVRRTMPELESNHLRFLRRQLAGVAEYKAASRQLVFPGGSVLELGYCACDGDMDRYQGAEFNGITSFPQNFPYLPAVNINRKVKLYRLQRHFRFSIRVYLDFFNEVSDKTFLLLITHYSIQFSKILHDFVNIIKSDCFHLNRAFPQFCILNAFLQLYHCVIQSIKP